MDGRIFCIELFPKWTQVFWASRRHGQSNFQRYNLSNIAVEKGSVYDSSTATIEQRRISKLRTGNLCNSDRQKVESGNIEKSLQLILKLANMRLLIRFYLKLITYLNTILRLSLG